MSSKSFCNLLSKRYSDVQSRLCVGVDPHPDILKSNSLEHLRDWSFGLIEALSGSAAGFKFQFAFFQRYGPGGLAVMKDAIDFAKSKSAVVILDAKYSDIPSTLNSYISAALAEAHVDCFSWNVDAITVNPFLALEGVKRIYESRMFSEKCVYVLLTPASNIPSELALKTQLKFTEVAEQVLNEIYSWKPVASTFDIGFVVSAIYPQFLMEHSKRVLDYPLLVPGIGVQGGSIEKLNHILPRSEKVLYVVSRSLLIDQRGLDFNGVRERAIAISASIG